MSPKKKNSPVQSQLPASAPTLRWQSLCLGDRVEVWAEDRVIFCGSVSDRTEDGEVLWLIEDGLGSRRFFLRGDNVSIYRAE